MIKCLTRFRMRSPGSRLLRRFCATSPAQPNQHPNAASSLKKFIIEKIKINGPISVADYMKLAASTYYSSGGDIFGNKGDFVTSPEISQMFGEMIGVWCAHEVRKLAHKGEWQLTELGPGNGTLMHDLLRTLRRLRMTDERLTVNLVEFSEMLAERQSKLLRGSIDRSPSVSVSDRDQKHYQRLVSEFGPTVSWFRDVEDVERKFSVVIAHEFFDALPIHKFQRSPKGVWREVYIDIDLSTGRLRQVLAPAETFAQKLCLTSEYLREVPEHVDHLEISPRSAYIARYLADLIGEEGGFVLIVDYGYDRRIRGDTLRIFAQQQLIDDFLSVDPGAADITADVDFSYLKDHVKDRVCCFGPTSQAEFLENLGIRMRYGQLMTAAKSENDRKHLTESFEKLTSSSQMGDRFKVFGMFPKVLEPYLAVMPPAGFVAPA